MSREIESIDSVAANAGADPSPTSPHPTSGRLFITTHPLVAEKDKSIHSEHGIIHYPFYFGGLASCVSNVCTQPLGVREFLPIRSRRCLLMLLQSAYASLSPVSKITTLI